MRIVLAVIAVLTANAAALGTAAAVTPGFTDAICPEGTHYVLQVGKLRTDDPPERIYAAATELVRDRAMAQNVADWITETEAFGTANVHSEPVTIAGDHRPSMYRDSAREIVLSADEGLAEVARLTDVPRRQGLRPSPSPSPRAPTP